MRHRRVASLLLLAGAALAQNQPRLQFEVAAVKPVEPGRMALPGLHGGPGTSSPGRLSGAASLKQLLRRAYGLNAYQISGPAWMDSARYEVDAAIPAGATREQVSLMLQALLAERFGLVAHRETRELPFYALVIRKRGPKLQPSSTAGPAEEDQPAEHAVPRLERRPDGIPELSPGSAVPRSYEIVVGGPDGILYKLWARRETMQQLADRLSSQLSQPVLDKTGLPGQYDFALTWTMENAGGGVPRTDPPPDEIDFHGTPVLPEPGLSIFTAVEAQLGLKLEQRKGPLPMVVVDRVDRTPTEN